MIVKSTPARILHMILEVLDQDFRVVYKEGKANIADFLSRNAPPLDQNSEEEKLDLELSDDLEVTVVKKVRQQHENITMNFVVFPFAT